MKADNPEKPGSRIPTLFRITQQEINGNPVEALVLFDVADVATLLKNRQPGHGVQVGKALGRPQENVALFSHYQKAQMPES